MKVGTNSYHTVWFEEGVLRLIDQTLLPHQFKIKELRTVEESVGAIKRMEVRGAPAIGVTGGFAVLFALREASRSRDFEARFEELAREIRCARPTAVNLSWAVDKVAAAVKAETGTGGKEKAALETAQAIFESELLNCKSIGEWGAPIIEEIAKRKNGKPVKVMTHCNAGWLACVDYGTATAPLYLAFEKNIPLEVLVSETRPRNQGFSLTAWELAQQGVPHALLVDNAAGILMQRGEVDMVIVGCDRASRGGDVANKVGTYLKALAAKAHGIPFYVALPSSSIDWSIEDGVREIEIELRSGAEVTKVSGLCGEEIKEVRIAPDGSSALNYAFDVTPAELISGLITEKGVCRANEADMRALFFPGE